MADAWLNYGIATGPLLVVDIDPRNGGDKQWEKLYRKPSRYLPHTWEVITGSGGRHIIFANPTGIGGPGGEDRLSTLERLQFGASTPGAWITSS